MKKSFKPRSIKIKYVSSVKDKAYAETVMVTESSIKYTKQWNIKTEKSDISWSMKLEKESFKNSFNELFAYLDQFFDRQKMLVPDEDKLSLELADEIGVKRKVLFTSFTSPEMMVGLIKFFKEQVTDKLPLPAFIKDL